LLVFFVWTSSFELPEFDLPTAIAEPPSGMTSESTSSPPVEPFDEVVISLTMRDGQTRINFNGQPIADASAVREKLSQIISLGVQPPVIIDPADEVTMNVAVEVYDAARAAGVDRVLFAADPE
jgi:biopolymer transport protein ExbD